LDTVKTGGRCAMKSCPRLAPRQIARQQMRVARYQNEIIETYDLLQESAKPYGRRHY